MNKKKLLLHLNSIQNLIDTIRLELDEEDTYDPQPKNTISIPELIKDSYVDLEEDVQYAEERDEGPKILLNNKEELKFYERFRLGE
jgi:hypothetical protein